MQGAREYMDVLTRCEQVGRLYIVPSSHARGTTLRVYVLPEGVTAKQNFNNAPLNCDAVEVYGITGGQPGWTESYGWLHHGPWMNDFNKHVEALRAEKAKKEEDRKNLKSTQEQAERERISGLLSDYK